MDQEKIEQLIVATLEEVTEVLEIQPADPISANTQIFGQRGFLSSMGLVTFITDLEERIEEELGETLILADDRAMSQERSPFRSISSLTQYVTLLLENGNKSA
jgi:acyl carrier protein